MPIRIPIVAVIAAVPRAVHAAKLVTAEAHGPLSPGGAKVTPLEVTEAIAAFLAALAEDVTPAVLAANGHPGSPNV